MVFALRAGDGSVSREGFCLLRKTCCSAGLAYPSCLGCYRELLDDGRELDKIKHIGSSQS